MDSTSKERTFTDIVRENPAYRDRLFLRTAEVARIIGVTPQTISKEMRLGRMRYHLPPGHKQGRLVKPEWVDEWIERSTHEPA